MRGGERSGCGRFVDDDLRGRRRLTGRIMIFDDQSGEAAAQTSGLDPGIPSWWVGDPGLDDEAAAGSQVPGRVLEAFDLALLGAHGVDRVDQGATRSDPPSAVVVAKSPHSA